MNDGRGEGLRRDKQRAEQRLNASDVVSESCRGEEGGFLKPAKGCKPLHVVK